MLPEDPHDAFNNLGNTSWGIQNYEEGASPVVAWLYGRPNAMFQAPNDRRQDCNGVCANAALYLSQAIVSKLACGLIDVRWG
jgi:hypothetical protein